MNVTAEYSGRPGAPYGAGPVSPAVRPDPFSSDSISASTASGASASASFTSSLVCSAAAIGWYGGAAASHRPTSTGCASPSTRSASSGDDPGLADPGLAGQQQEPTATGGHRLPGGVQPGNFRATAHHAGPGRRREDGVGRPAGRPLAAPGDRWRRRRAVRARQQQRILTEDALGERLQLWTGVEAEFVGQALAGLRRTPPAPRPADRTGTAPPSVARRTVRGTGARRRAPPAHRRSPGADRPPARRRRALRGRRAAPLRAGPPPPPRHRPRRGRRTARRANTVEPAAPESPPAPAGPVPAPPGRAR